MKPTYIMLALGSAALSACVAAKNSVEIDVTEARGVAGSVMLCNRETPLIVQGTHLKASVPVTCEGVGEVRLRLANDANATCQIGYVSPGLEQDFQFALKDDQCVPIP